MTTITANQLKTRGVSALEQALAEGGEAVISVRGKPRYVALELDEYERLREAELYAAWQQAREDVAAGRYRSESAAAHCRVLEQEPAQEG